MANLGSNFINYNSVKNAPPGWVSIHTWSPECKAVDLLRKGYTVLKVKYEDGYIGVFKLYPNVREWKQSAENRGITHWWNDS